MKTIIDTLGWWTIPIVIFGLYYLTWTITYLILVCLNIRNGILARHVRAMKKFFTKYIYRKKVEIVGDIILILLSCIGILFWIALDIVIVTFILVGGFIPGINNLFSSSNSIDEKTGKDHYNAFPSGMYKKTPIIRFWIWVFTSLGYLCVAFFYLRLRKHTA